MKYEADPRVDDYIDALPEWQQQICRRVRELIHAADEGIAETIKRRVQPYFVLEGNVARIAANNRGRLAQAQGRARRHGLGPAHRLG